MQLLNLRKIRKHKVFLFQKHELKEIKGKLTKREYRFPPVSDYLSTLT